MQSRVLDVSPTGTSLRSTDEQMLRIRLLEDRLQELCLNGDGADLHFSRGQEAIPVGVCAALRETDYVVTHHRTIAHAIAKGVPLRPLIAELLGKAEGLNGGMAGEMHMSYPAARFMFSFQLVGTCVPVAAGLAWAVKHYLKTDDIVVVFHGHAATANGQWHEGMNIAAVQKLPLLLVCENNRVAGNVTSDYYSPVMHIRQKAGAYGILSNTVDGNDISEVRKAAEFAAKWVRARSEPFLLECVTARLGRHKQGMGDIRTKEELAALTLRDPLLRVDVDPRRRDAIEHEIAEIIEAVRAAPGPQLPREE